MTPSQIAQWTVEMPTGRVFPRSATQWFSEGPGGDLEGPFETRPEAIEAHQAHWGEDGDMCLNCGS
jgi:hypothetical protein